MGGWVGGWLDLGLKLTQPPIGVGAWGSAWQLEAIFFKKMISVVILVRFWWNGGLYSSGVDLIRRVQPVLVSVWGLVQFGWNVLELVQFQLNFWSICSQFLVDFWSISAGSQF